jgi:hypothetical protein
VATGRLTGKVTDRVTNLPLAQVEVLVGEASERDRVFKTQTAADGSFHLEGLPQGKSLLVSTQPVIGSVVYKQEVGAPLVLGQGVQPPDMNLACTQTTTFGNLEVRYGSVAARPLTLSLLRDRNDFADGQSRHVLARHYTLPADRTTVTYTHIPAGRYSVLFGPLGGVPSGVHEEKDVRVKAGETVILTPPEAYPATLPRPTHQPDPPRGGDYPKVVHHPHL